MRPPVPTWRDRAVQALHHPRTSLALKTAAAACLSWLIAVNLPEPARSYPYYAPLGAVVTMYPTVASSARQSMQGVAAITIGAALALVADGLLGHGVVVLALTVGMAVLLGGLPWLGSQRTYVPIAALFVLLIGRDHDMAYAASYAGLFLLGALVTVAVNAAFPAFPVRRAQDTLVALRDAVAAHLEYLAERLRRPGEGEPLKDRDAGRPGLTALTTTARSAVREVVESTKANRRARHEPEVATSLRDSFRALERVVLLVDDLYALAADQPWGQDLLSVSEEVRTPMARALEELAAAVRSVGLDDTEPGRRAAVDSAVTELTAALRRRERAASAGDGGTAGTREDRDAEAEWLVVSTIVTTLRRTLSVLTPPDRIRLSPTPEGDLSGGRPRDAGP